eukprot:g4277.t1
MNFHKILINRARSSINNSLPLSYAREEKKKLKNSLRCRRKRQKEKLKDRKRERLGTIRRQKFRRKKLGSLPGGLTIEASTKFKNPLPPPELSKGRGKPAPVYAPTFSPMSNLRRSMGGVPSLPESLSFLLQKALPKERIGTKSPISILDCKDDMEKIERLSPRHCRSPRHINTEKKETEFDAIRRENFRVREKVRKQIMKQDETSAKLEALLVRLDELCRQRDHSFNALQGGRLDLIAKEKREVNMREGYRAMVDAQATEIKNSPNATKEENDHVREAGLIADIAAKERQEQANLVERQEQAFKDSKSAIIRLEAEIRICREQLEKLSIFFNQIAMEEEDRESKRAIEMAKSELQCKLENMRKEAEEKAQKMMAKELIEKKELERRKALGLPSYFNSRGKSKSSKRRLRCKPCGKKFMTQRDYIAHCKSGAHLRIINRVNQEKMKRMKDELGIDMSVVVNYQAKEEEDDVLEKKKIQKQALPALTMQKRKEQWFGKGCGAFNAVNGIHKKITKSKRTKHVGGGCLWSENGQYVGIDNKWPVQDIQGYESLAHKYKRRKKNDAILYSSGDPAMFDMKFKRPFLRRFRDLPDDHIKVRERLLPTADLHKKEPGVLLRLSETNAIPDVPVYRASTPQIMKGITDKEAIMFDLFRTAAMRD